MDGRVRRLDQRSAQPGTAFASSTTEPLACALMVAWIHACEGAPDGALGKRRIVEFLAHQSWFLAPHRLVAQAQMGFLLVDAGFNLPALMVAEDEFCGRRLLRVQQSRHQPKHLARISAVTRLI